MLGFTLKRGGGVPPPLFIPPPDLLPNDKLQYNEHMLSYITSFCYHVPPFTCARANAHARTCLGCGKECRKCGHRGHRGRY